MDLQPGDPGQVGQYRLEGRLGVGGMGQVFLGRSPGGRRVAVKLIRAEHADSQQFRSRFAREVEAARRVRGFYTAEVLDADPRGDPPWMVTAYVPGPSLHRAVTDVGRFPGEVVLRLGAGLAEGLAAIHSCDLVHRDLKPSNVILAGDGPRIIDFGIARTLDDSALTESGAVLGTYAYMSPEQVQGKPVEAASDVFSFGSVLTFAATGRSPFGGGPVIAVARRITNDPPDLSDVQGRALLDLIAACLCKDPQRRPSSDDLLQWLSSLPACQQVSIDDGWLPAPIQSVVNSYAVEADSLAPDPSARPDQRRAPTAPPPSAVKRTPAISHPAPARRSRGSGEQNRDVSDRLVAIVTVVVVAAVLLVVGLFVRAINERITDGGATSAPSAQSYLSVTLTGHRGAVGPVAFSPDGKTLATGGDDKTVRLWDVAGRKTTATLTGHSGGVGSVAFSPDGRILATGSSDKTVRLWDVATRRTTATLTGHRGGIRLTFGPDGKTLATGSWDKTVRLWDVATGRTTATLTGHTVGIWSVAFSPDSRILATGSGDKTVRLWDVATRRTTATLIHTGTGHNGEVFSLAFSPNGGTVATGGYDGKVRLWNPATSRIIATLTGNKSWVVSLAFSLDGKTLATGGDDKTVRLWDVAGRETTATLTGHTGGVGSVAFSPDGKTLSSGSLDGTVRLWKIR